MILVQRLKSYRLADLRGDGIAGATVAVLVVPQAMAYALLAGVPPVVGLYAAIVPALVYAWLGASPHLAVGPVALTSLLVASGLGPLAAPFSAEYTALAALLALLVGVLLIVLGLLRAGFLVNFLSHPTIIGFNAAAAILTALSQVRPMLGIPRTAVVGATAENPWPVFGHLGLTNAPSLTMGLAATIALLLVARLARRVPGPLIVTIVGTLAAATMALPDVGVAVVGEIPRGLPPFLVPTVELDTLGQLAPAAVSIIVVGYASSITVIKALAVRSRDQVAPNRELWSLGAANVAGSLFGSFPVTGGLSRTTVNADAGARSQLAGLIAAGLVMATLVALAPLFTFVPLPVLAAIIILAASRLIDITGAIEVFRTRRSDGVVMVSTFVATMGVGIEEGLLVGVVLALAFFVRRTAIPHSAELGRIPGSMVYRNTLRYQVETCPQIGILRVDAPLYYANTRFLEDRVNQMCLEREHLQLLVLECSGVGDMDATAVQTLYRVAQGLRSRGNDLHIVGAIGPVRDILTRTGHEDLLGSDHMHRSIIEAAPQLMGTISREFCESQCHVAAFPDCTLIPRKRLSTDDAEARRFSPQI